MDLDKEAEALSEELVSQVNPRVLDKLLVLLERHLRRFTSQRILEEKCLNEGNRSLE